MSSSNYVIIFNQIEIIIDYNNSLNFKTSTQLWKTKEQVKLDSLSFTVAISLS